MVLAALVAGMEDEALAPNDLFFRINKRQRDVLECHAHRNPNCGPTTPEVRDAAVYCEHRLRAVGWRITIPESVRALVPRVDDGNDATPDDGVVPVVDAIDNDMAFDGEPYDQLPAPADHPQLPAPADHPQLPAPADHPQLPAPADHPQLPARPGQVADRILFAIEEMQQQFRGFQREVREQVREVRVVIHQQEVRTTRRLQNLEARLKNASCKVDEALEQVVDIEGGEYRGRTRFPTTALEILALSEPRADVILRHFHNVMPAGASLKTKRARICLLFGVNLF